MIKAIKRKSRAEEAEGLIRARAELTRELAARINERWSVVMKSPDPDAARLARFGLDGLMFSSGQMPVRILRDAVLRVMVERQVPMSVVELEQATLAHYPVLAELRDLPQAIRSAVSKGCRPEGPFTIRWRGVYGLKPGVLPAAMEVEAKGEGG